MSMTHGEILQVLINARAMISNPAHWTRGAAARLPDGASVAAGHEGAAMWCSWGAVMKVTNTIPSEHPPLEICAALGFRQWYDLYGANDDARGHEDALLLFDRAIARTIRAMGQEQPAQVAELAHAE